MHQQKTCRFVAAMVCILVTGCAAIRPYEKEYLLSPLMDDGLISTLQPLYGKAVGSAKERLATGAGNGGGTACPTCGG